MSKQGCEQSQYYQEDFLANHSVQPGSEEARRMTVTSGRKCSELYRESGPLGLLVKTLLESSQWRSTRCYLTWKASATPARRLLFRLVPSTPRTEGTELPLLPTPTATLADHGGPNQRDSSGRPGLQMAAMMFPTPTRFDAECGDLKGKEYNGRSRHAMKLIQAAKLLPTPTARDSKGANSYQHISAGNHVDQLANAVKLFPTPTARCGQSPCKHGEGGPDLSTYVKLIPTATTGAGMCGGSANYQRLKEMEDAGVITAEERRSMAAGNGGQLNPMWVEWLMGFPLGWTDLSASEMPSCHSSSTQSSGQ